MTDRLLGKRDVRRIETKAEMTMSLGAESVKHDAVILISHSLTQKATKQLDEIWDDRERYSRIQSGST